MKIPNKAQQALTMIKQTCSSITRQWQMIALAIALPLAQVHAQNIAIEAASVDIAQTHVLNADGNLGPNGGAQPRIVGQRELFLKVNFIADQPNVAKTKLSAWLTVFDAQNQKTTLRLTAPLNLTAFPTTFNSAPAALVHSFDNSYSATIPAQWVKPGLTWELSWLVFDATGKASTTRSMHSGPMNIGPPHKLILSMIDVQWFEPESPFKEFAPTLFSEMQQKLPISGLELRRSKNNIFPKVAMPSVNGKLPSIVSSVAEWRANYGDGEVTRSSRWASVLQKAAGLNYYEVANFCVINHGTIASGGVGADGYFCSSQANDGVFWHEFGHTFMLRHWGETSTYPYKDPDNDGPLTYPSYLGLSSGSIYRNTHAGPYWAFDSRDKANATGTLVAPWVDTNSDGTPDRWKAEPMQGGGLVDAAAGFTLAHFSDYSINQISSVLDNKAAWFSADNAWINDADWAARGAGWYNTSSAGYTSFTGDGSGRPVAADLSVYSIMIAGSMASNGGATPFTLIYPTIGPYKSNVRRLYDPRTEQAALAQSGVCPAGGCDLSLRVVQGGVTKVYALEVDWDTTKPFSDLTSFFEKAVNVPASQGTVGAASVQPISSIELLHTPDVAVRGFPAVPAVLSQQLPPPVTATEMVLDEGSRTELLNG